MPNLTRRGMLAAGVAAVVAPKDAISRCCCEEAVSLPEPYCDWISEDTANFIDFSDFQRSALAAVAAHYAIPQSRIDNGPF